MAMKSTTVGKGLLGVGMLLFLSSCASLTCSFGPWQNEFREAESQISKIEGNLARGYALHRSERYESVPYTTTETYCVTADALGCLHSETRTITKYRDELRYTETPIAIDVEAERSRLSYWYGVYAEAEPLAAAEYDDCIAAKVNASQ